MNLKINIFKIPNIEIFGRSETRSVSEIQKIIRFSGSLARGVRSR